MNGVRTVAISALALGMLLEGCGRERKLSTTSEEAVHRYLDGVTLTDKFYYAEAKDAFQKSLAADSTFAMAWARLAALNANLENEPEALHDIARALRFAPKVTRREQLFIGMWNDRLHYDTKAAIAAADSLATLYPDEKEAYLFLGNLYEKNKEFDASIRSYQKAIVIDSTYAPAVMSLGYAYSAINEQEKAIVQMQRYIRLAPEAADPLASYADLLVRAGRYEEALVEYRKSLNLKPDYWYAIRQIGNVYAIMGRLNAAGEQFHRALHLLPASAQLEASGLAADAFLNFHRGKYQEAVNQYTDALRTDTTSFEAAFGMVYTLGKLHRFAEAERTVSAIEREFERRRLSGSVAMLGFYLMRSRLLAEEDSLPEALAACRQALEFSSPLTRGAVFQQMAKIHLRQSEFEPALDDCEEALQINPNAPETLLALTQIYREKGDLRMTREIGGRLLDLWNKADPDFVELGTLRHLLSTKHAV